MESLLLICGENEKPSKIIRATILKSVEVQGFFELFGLFSNSDNAPFKEFHIANVYCA